MERAGAGDDTGTITSVRDMIARFRNSPARSREERFKVTQKEPRLWWEGAEKAALRENAGEDIIKKYGLLKDAGDFKMASRIERGGGTASLLDHNLAAAEGREDETDGLRASYARQSQESLSRFRGSLRDSWGAGGSDAARFFGGRQSSSYNDVVNLRASHSLGPGFRALLRDDLRLDGSQNLRMSRAEGTEGGRTHDSDPPESSPRDLSRVPAVQADLDELLAKLRTDSLELQRMYDSALAPQSLKSVLQSAQQNQQQPMQTLEEGEGQGQGQEEAKEKEQERDWARIIAEIERNTFDVGAVAARDRAARDRARAEQDNRMRQVGRFEEQWQQLFPEHREPGGLPSTLTITVPPCAPSRPPHAPDQQERLLPQHPHYDQHQHQHQQQHQHQHQRQQEGEGELHFRRSSEGQSWALERDHEADLDEHWRHREHREFLKSQRGEVAERRAEVPQSTGRGCWQGFGRFSPVDVLVPSDEARDPRWVQSHPARPAAPRLAQNEAAPRSPQYARPSTSAAAAAAAAPLEDDDATYLPRRLLELEAAEHNLQKEIEQQRARMQRPASPRPPAPVSPRQLSAPSSPRRETFSILQGRDPLPLHLALDFSLDNVLGREGRGPPRASLSRGPPLLTMAQAARPPAALELPDHWRSDSPSDEHKEQQAEHEPAPSAPAPAPAPGPGSGPGSGSGLGYRVRASDMTHVPSKESAHEKLRYLEQMRRRRWEMQQSLAALAMH